MTIEAAKRVITIQTNVVKRLQKDVVHSLKEVEMEHQRLIRLQDNGGDEYEIRAQEKVIADAEQMVPDYGRRLQSAREELDTIITRENATLQGCSELALAQDVYEQTSAIDSGKSI